jgi:hypothetical protein
MLASDFNGDKRLDRTEFTQLLLRLSTSSGIAFQRLLDFLLELSALTDDVQKEKKCVPTYLRMARFIESSTFSMRTMMG